jgi:hypothetical protein
MYGPQDLKILSRPQRNIIWPSVIYIIAFSTLQDAWMPLRST